MNKKTKLLSALFAVFLSTNAFATTNQSSNVINFNTNKIQFGTGVLNQSYKETGSLDTGSGNGTLDKETGVIPYLKFGYTTVFAHNIFFNTNIEYATGKTKYTSSNSADESVKTKNKFLSINGSIGYVFGNNNYALIPKLNLGYYSWKRDIQLQDFAAQSEATANASYKSMYTSGSLEYQYFMQKIIFRAHGGLGLTFANSANLNQQEGVNYNNVKLKPGFWTTVGASIDYKLTNKLLVGADLNLVGYSWKASKTLGIGTQYEGDEPDARTIHTTFGLHVSYLL